MALPTFAQNLKDVMRVILRSRLSLRRPTKRRPDGIWLPDRFHLGTCLYLVHAQQGVCANRPSRWVSRAGAAALVSR